MKLSFTASCILIALILVCGCTGTTSEKTGAEAAPTSAPSDTPQPTAAVETQTEPPQQPTVTTVETTTPHATEPSRTVLADEGSAVYAGSWKQISFTDDLGVEFLYPNERYEISIKSSQPINVLVLKDPNVPLFKTNSPVWDGNGNKWKYDSGVDPVVQFDEITRKTFTMSVPGVGRYSLLLDGRMSPNGVLVINDAASVEVMITKLS